MSSAEYESTAPPARKMLAGKSVSVGKRRSWTNRTILFAVSGSPLMTPAVTNIASSGALAAAESAALTSLSVPVCQKCTLMSNALAAWRNSSVAGATCAAL